MEEDRKLESLPEELLLYTICNFLQPRFVLWLLCEIKRLKFLRRDVLIASQVSQRFYGLCNDTFVWKVYTT